MIIPIHAFHVKKRHSRFTIFICTSTGSILILILILGELYTVYCILLPCPSQLTADSNQRIVQSTDRGLRMPLGLLGVNSFVSCNMAAIVKRKAYSVKQQIVRVYKYTSFHDEGNRK